MGTNILPAQRDLTQQIENTGPLCRSEVQPRFHTQSRDRRSPRPLYHRCRHGTGDRTLLPLPIRAEPVSPVPVHVRQELPGIGANEGNP